MSDLIYVSHTQLKIHPKNIRIYYPPNDVAEMARSLLATTQTRPSGNIQALLVVPVGDQPGYYYVVDGNLRLTAGRTLNEKCPAFKCEVIEGGQAEQLLVMVTTGLHYPKDPISEGRHYRRLVEEEGYTIRLIAESTGLSQGTIGSRLACLDLDEEIQEFIMKRELAADVRLVRALKAIPDRDRRVGIAQYYARRDVAIGTMIRRIRDVAERVHQVNGDGAAYRKARAAAKAKAEAAMETRSRLRDGGLDETSTALIWRLAGEFLCEGCKLNGLTTECYLCPGPQEFIEHLVELAEARTQAEVGAIQGAEAA